ncbi:hypothetical protein G9A89_000305 [Geosiphon pyriformis]|nr:hypothetical protein G9A89_000305 [Geosiphon pyriformis]
MLMRGWGGGTHCSRKLPNHLDPNPQDLVFAIMRTRNPLPIINLGQGLQTVHFGVWVGCGGGACQEAQGGGIGIEEHVWLYSIASPTCWNPEQDPIPTPILGTKRIKYYDSKDSSP